MYKYLFKSLLSLLLGAYPEVELLHHMVIIRSLFKGTAVPSSIAVTPCYVPTSSPGGLGFLHFSTNARSFPLVFIIVSCRREVGAHRGFRLHVPNDQDGEEGLLLCLLVMGVSSLEKGSTKASAHFSIRLFAVEWQVNTF